VVYFEKDLATYRVCITSDRNGGRSGSGWMKKSTSWLGVELLGTDMWDETIQDMYLNCDTSLWKREDHRAEGGGTS
jgi:hypothetical protein